MNDDFTEVQDNWIRFNFSNFKDFERTYPAYSRIGKTRIEGKNWAKLLEAIVENEIVNENPSLESLYKNALVSNKGRSFFLAEKVENQNCSKLSMDIGLISILIYLN